MGGWDFLHFFLSWPLFDATDAGPLPNAILVPNAMPVPDAVPVPNAMPVPNSMPLADAVPLGTYLAHAVYLSILWLIISLQSGNMTDEPYYLVAWNQLMLPADPVSVIHGPHSCDHIIWSCCRHWQTGSCWAAMLKWKPCNTRLAHYTRMSVIVFTWLRWKSWNSKMSHWRHMQPWRKGWSVIWNHLNAGSQRFQSGLHS